MSFDPKVPPSLLELQIWFGKMAARPFRKMGEFKIPKYDKRTESAIEKRIAPGPKLSAIQRMGLYNQQYWWRLFALMQDHYQGLVRLFGYGDFNRSIAEPYLMKYVPNDWSFSTLGSRLPRWIEEEYHEDDRLLVLQIALVDESHERLPFARERPPLQPQDVKETIYLQSWISLLALDADLFTFREKLVQEEIEHWETHDFPPLEWSEKKRRFALYRVEGGIDSEEISEGEYLLLKSFEKGARIEELSASLKEMDGPRVESWFKKWASRGWFTREKGDLL